MTKTRNDLIQQALGVLGVLAAGQTPAAEDTDAVNNHLDGLIASLSRRNIITVDDPEAIPDEWFLALAVLLADRSSDVFGMPGLPTAPGQPNQALAAEMELREIEYARPTFEPLRTHYF
jgi:hypothetical protein